LWKERTVLDRTFVVIDGDIKYICHGRIRHVGQPEVLQTYGDIKFHEVTAEEIAELKLGPVVPSKWSLQRWVEGAADSALLMRDLMISVATGAGIEIGAGPHALRFPIECDIQYVDAYSSEAELERTWPKN
jgi:hypothetical protein